MQILDAAGRQFASQLGLQYASAGRQCDSGVSLDAVASHGMVRLHQPGMQLASVHATALAFNRRSHSSTMHCAHHKTPHTHNTTTPTMRCCTPCAGCLPLLDASDTAGQKGPPGAKFEPCRHRRAAPPRVTPCDPQLQRLRSRCWQGPTAAGGHTENEGATPSSTENGEMVAQRTNGSVVVSAMVSSTCDGDIHLRYAGLKLHHP
jgi:hypothetical protein